MNPSLPDDLSSRSLLELFRLEAESQTAVLTSGLLELERSARPDTFEALMRAAHSLKGAARIVNLQTAVRIAHAIEDCFVAARQGELSLRRTEIDLLLQGVDLLVHFSKQTEAEVSRWEQEHAAGISRFLDGISRLVSGGNWKPHTMARSRPPGPAPGSAPVVRTTPRHSSPAGPIEAAAPRPKQSGPIAPVEPASQAVTVRKPEAAERVLRLTAENLNRLLGLAGEALVESRWLGPFADSLQRLKRHHMDLAQKLQSLRAAVEENASAEQLKSSFNDVTRQLAEAQQFLAERTQELNQFDRRSVHLSHRLYLEVLRTRMRPFSDGVRRFPRMVRDLARSLGKEIKLELCGEAARVDRDILERLETPLAHLLRNAADHGCETPEDRRRAGKPLECLVRLEARHSAGVLLVTVSDDGRGVELPRLRAALVQKRLTTPAVAKTLSESQLLEFLFLPGFTLKETVTEISGRGFGLDIVQNMVKSVRGTLRLANHPGRGFWVQLQVPITLSVLRALLVEIAGEPYAIPLSQITRTLKVHYHNLQTLEGRSHFQFDGQQVALFAAHQVLECRKPKLWQDELQVVILGDRNARYGLVVDRLLGERELVVQPLDPRLGKVADISAAALMEDGAPVLITDVEELVRSMDKLLAEGRLARISAPRQPPPAPKTKRILAVGDSITVRELERKLLTSRGYLTEVAADGLEAWTAVRAERYDLIITDIDMPRMGGIELASLIKKDPQLKSVPVLIVSYNDQQQDRLRGLEAGADYYLAKGAFEDETLLQAVTDLIGEPEA